MIWDVWALQKHLKWLIIINADTYTPLPCRLAVLELDYPLAVGGAFLGVSDLEDRETLFLVELGEEFHDLYR